MPFEKCGTLRDGVWMTFGEFYDVVRMVKARDGELDIRSEHGHTYAAGL